MHIKTKITTIIINFFLHYIFVTQHIGRQKKKDFCTKQEKQNNQKKNHDIHGMYNLLPHLHLHASG